MDYKYAFQGFDEKTMAKAVGRSLPISTKHSVEIASGLRGMAVDKAKKILEDVIALKKPVKITRFNKDLGHKKKIGPGRFPVKTAQNILNVLKLAEANAADKGLSKQDLSVIHVCAQKAAGRWHYGRQRRRQFKSSHVEVVVQEQVRKERRPRKGAVKEKPAAEEKKPATKKEVQRPEVKKEMPKTTPAKQEPKPEGKNVAAAEPKPKTEKKPEAVKSAPGHAGKAEKPKKPEAKTEPKAEEIKHKQAKDTAEKSLPAEKNEKVQKESKSPAPEQNQGDKK